MTQITTVALEQLYRQRQQGQRTNTQKGNQCLMKHLQKFLGETPTTHHLTRSFCISFAQYLTKEIKINSARTYLQKLHAIIEESIRQGYLTHNPMPRMNELLPHTLEPQRAYLLPKEIQRLEQSHCPHQNTRDAFLFACHTGLRLSDIETLTWDNIRHCNGHYELHKIQVKTNHEVIIGLDRESLQILSRLQQFRTPSDNRVFHLYSRTIISRDLHEWASNAGLNKHITFHVARHTYATLLLNVGIDIYKVSKFLGHRNVKTTEIYVAILDTSRQNAVRKFNILFAKTHHYSTRYNFKL